MANDNFYSNPRKPIPAWSSFDGEELRAGDPMEFGGDSPTIGGGKEPTGGGGGDIGGANQFMMTIDGTQALDLDPEGQPIPSPVFSFRVLAGTVTFQGDEFDGELTQPVEALRTREC